MINSISAKLVKIAKSRNRFRIFYNSILKKSGPALFFGAAGPEIVIIYYYMRSTSPL